MDQPDRHVPVATVYPVETPSETSIRRMDDGNLLPVYLLRFDRPQTRRAYRNDLVQFFETDFITMELARRISFVQVNAHLDGLDRAGQKPATLQRRLAAIRGFFDWLMALQIVDQHPANRQLVRRVRGVSKRDRAIVFLTAKQARKMIDATAGHGEAAMRDRVLLLVLLHGCLRRSEAAAMNVEHVRPLGHYWVLDLPLAKGGSDQYVKLPPHVVEEIEALRAQYGISSGPMWRSLSNNSRNRRLSAHSIYQIVKRSAAEAGLASSIGAHTLRHTGCTLAIEAGATLQQVQAHARHKNIETTMTYIHQRDRLRDSAADYIKL